MKINRLAVLLFIISLSHSAFPQRQLSAEELNAITEAARIEAGERSFAVDSLGNVTIFNEGATEIPNETEITVPISSIDPEFTTTPYRVRDFGENVHEGDIIGLLAFEISTTHNIFSNANDRVIAQEWASMNSSNASKVRPLYDDFCVGYMNSNSQMSALTAANNWNLTNNSYKEDLINQYETLLNQLTTEGAEELETYKNRLHQNAFNNDFNFNLFAEENPTQALEMFTNLCNRFVDILRQN